MRLIKALVLSNQAKLQNLLWGLKLKHKVDVIAITHNPIAILQSAAVYDFKNKSCIVPEEYIKNTIGQELILKNK